MQKPSMYYEIAMSSGFIAGVRQPCSFQRYILNTRLNGRRFRSVLASNRADPTSSKISILNSDPQFNISTSVIDIIDFFLKFATLEGHR